MITDELRAYTESQIKWLDMTKVHYRNLLEIADHIDAEHEKSIVDALLNDGLPMSDEVMAKNGWILLPVDADGEYIHIGDVMDSKVDYLFDGKPFMVRAMVLCEDGWEAADGRFGNRYKPDSLHHHKPPTIEDVMVEFATDWDCAPDGEDKEAVLKEYAAKLQLRGDAE